MNPYGKHECKNDFHNPGCWKSGWAHKIQKMSSSYHSSWTSCGVGPIQFTSTLTNWKEASSSIKPNWLLRSDVAVTRAQFLDRTLCVTTNAFCLHICMHMQDHSYVGNCTQCMFISNTVFLHACQCILMVLRDLEDSGGVLLSGWILRPRLAPQPHCLTPIPAVRNGEQIVCMM